MIQKSFAHIRDDNQPPHLSMAYNKISIYTSVTSLSSIGITLMLPIQSLQQAKSNENRSRADIFQLCSAISSSHPSGISPSKNGNRTLSLYGLSDRGKVKLTGIAESDAKYSGRYMNSYPASSSVSMPARILLIKTFARFIRQKVSLVPFPPQTVQEPD